MLTLVFSSARVLRNLAEQHYMPCFGDLLLQLYDLPSLALVCIAPWHVSTSICSRSGRTPGVAVFVSSPTRRVKTRQHVNPLAATFQAPVVLPERWFPSAFRDPSAPLLVDIGKDCFGVVLSLMPICYCFPRWGSVDRDACRRCPPGRFLLPPSTSGSKLYRMWYLPAFIFHCFTRVSDAERELKYPFVSKNTTETEGSPLGTRPGRFALHMYNSIWFLS